MGRHGLFPARMLGFGFYWAWLFLACVTPSLFIGGQYVLGLPLETAELLVRLVFVLVIIAMASKIAAVKLERMLLGATLVSSVATSLLFALGSSQFAIAMVFFMGIADACMFMLWLCFFGNDRIGQTAIFLSASYAVGAIITLIVRTMPVHILNGCVLALPVISCATFWLSSRGVERAIEEPPSNELSGVPSPSPAHPFVRRICIAIGLYALSFALVTSTLFANGISTFFMGPVIEAPCCLLLGIILAFLFWKTKDAQSVYRGYKIVPILVALGAITFLVAVNNDIMTILACALIMLGYLTFEILGLNDLCNAVKLNSLSPIKTLGIMRIAITTGMLIGWFLGIASPYVSDIISPFPYVTFFIVPSTIVASTLIFTEKEVFSVRVATCEREENERADADSGTTDSKQAILQEAAAIEGEAVVAFGAKWRLSNREMEILPLLPQGKTAVYISEQLYVAPGTVKTHVHNIYRKLDIHSKMELLDSYNQFRNSIDN